MEFLRTKSLDTPKTFTSNIWSVVKSNQNKVNKKSNQRPPNN